MIDYNLVIHSSAGIKDYSATTESVTYTTDRQGNPSVLKFIVHKTPEANFHEGDLVRFIVENTVIFVGFVFTKVRQRWGEIEVTCYDQLRYLKAKGSYLFVNATVNDIIRQIADEFGLTVGAMDNTRYQIPYLLQENKTLLDIIVYAIELTSAHNNKRYVLYDDAGKITLRQIDNLKSNILLGDRSLVYDFNYTTDIDKDTYNSIKLARPNSETGLTDIYLYFNSTNVNRWGLLQYYEQVDEQMNEAQIDEMARLYLSYYNRVVRTLNLSSIGVIGLRAGQLVPVYIPEIGDISINQFLTIDKAVHTFEENRHTMDLEMRVHIESDQGIYTQGQVLT